MTDGFNNKRCVVIAVIVIGGWNAAIFANYRAIKTREFSANYCCVNFRGSDVAAIGTPTPSCIGARCAVIASMTGALRNSIATLAAWHPTDRLLHATLAFATPRSALYFLMMAASAFNLPSVSRWNSSCRFSGTPFSCHCHTDGWLSPMAAATAPCEP